MPRKPAVQESGITCTSQQSRFHTETLETSYEIDLKDVSVAVADKDLISGSHLRLKDGIRYALIGRNGTGKSTLLTAIAEKLIPGIHPYMTILLLSQVTDSARASEDEEMEADKSVHQHVVRGDRRRLEAMKERQALARAADATEITDTQKTVAAVKLDRARRVLKEAQSTALRRSGARGKEARSEEIKAEENVRIAESVLERAGEKNDNVDAVAEAAQLLAELDLRLDSLDAATTEARAASILRGLGFSQEMIEGPYEALSGGWRSRCSLATALLVSSDLLLLDEPSNFLDLEATLWLETFLNSQKRTLVLTSHDQAFLNNVVNETIILRHNKLAYFEGTPSASEINQTKENKRLSKQQAALDKKKEHIQNSIREGRASAKRTGDENRARMAKSRQKKLDDRWGVEQSAKGTRFKLNRDLAGYYLTARADFAQLEVESEAKVKINDPAQLRTQGNLIHFDDVSFWFPKAKKQLLSNVTFTVGQSGRCAFVGANGQGKSTLAKIILGEIRPSKGTVHRHPMLRIGYFSQHSVEEVTSVAEQFPNRTALEHFFERVQQGEVLTEQEARASLAAVGLQGKTVSETSLVALSGGQKVRLALALIIFRPPPLLLLDEVTTHVDTPTIKALGEALQSFSGGIILITHDRWFSRMVVEGAKYKDLQREDALDVSSDSSDEEDDEDEEVKTAVSGETFRVGGGRVKILDGGMQQYVSIVEKKMKKPD